MIKREYFMTRQDGVNIFRIYSDITPVLKQVQTGALYYCWVYKLDENGNETKEVDWEKSGLFDVEYAPYTYIEVDETLYENESLVLENENN